MYGDASKLVLSSNWSWALITLGMVLGLVSILPNAPGEWGRGALLAVSAVTITFAAGASADGLGILSLVITGLCAVSIIIGGPWGLIFGSLCAFGFPIWQFITGPLPLNSFLMPAFAVICFIAAIRGLL